MWRTSLAACLSDVGRWNKRSSGSFKRLSPCCRGSLCCMRPPVELFCQTSTRGRKAWASYWLPPSRLLTVFICTSSLRCCRPPRCFLSLEADAMPLRLIPHFCADVVCSACRGSRSTFLATKGTCSSLLEAALSVYGARQLAACTELTLSGNEPERQWRSARGFSHLACKSLKAET